MTCTRHGGLDSSPKPLSSSGGCPHAETNEDGKFCGLALLWAGEVNVQNVSMVRKTSMFVFLSAAILIFKKIQSFAKIASSCCRVWWEFFGGVAYILVRNLVHCHLWIRKRRLIRPASSLGPRWLETICVHVMCACNVSKSMRRK